jgi:hypothetical protein
VDGLQTSSCKARLGLNEQLLVSVEFVSRISSGARRTELGVDGEAFVDDVGGSLSKQDLPVRYSMETLGLKEETGSIEGEGLLSDLEETTRCWRGVLV